MSTIPFFEKILRHDHRDVSDDLFTGPIVIQEKIDGSNFAFGLVDGEVQAISRTQPVTDSSDPRFADRLKYLRVFAQLLRPGTVYRCEVVDKPRTNALTYGRAAKNGLVLFDVEDPTSGWRDSSRPAIEEWGRILDIDVAPELFRGEMKAEEFGPWWVEAQKTESLLGGPIEGVVIKNYGKRERVFGRYLYAKCVREEFKEFATRQKTDVSKDADPSEIGKRFGGPARWRKALQKLRDSGAATGTDRDIGLLIQAVRQDIFDEELNEIKELLWKRHQKHVFGGATAGLVEWFQKGAE